MRTRRAGRGSLLRTRVLLSACGVVLAAVGARRLLESGPADILATLWWLAGGVLAHDAVLAPSTVVMAVAASRVLPPWLRAPVAAGFVVLGSVTVVAIPVLGRFGARPDNATLLDRNYVAGELVFAALVAMAVAAGAWRRRVTWTAASEPPLRRRTPVR